MAMVVGTSAHDSQGSKPAAVVDMSMDTSASGEMDRADSKQTKKAVKSMKARIRRELEQQGESEAFFIHLGLLSCQYFRGAWKEAQAKGLLTVKNILASLSLLQRSDLIQSLLPRLNLSFDSSLKFQTWGMFAEGEPPDLFFDDIEESHVVVANSDEESDDDSARPSFSTYTSDYPPLLPVESLKKKEKPLYPIPREIKQKHKERVLKLLREKGPEKAEAFFRDEYEVDEQGQGERAAKAVSLINYYFPDLDDSKLASTLFADLEFATFYENIDESASTEMELLLIKKLLPQVSTAAELKSRLAEIHQQAVDSANSEMTRVMRDTASLIRNVCPNLEVSSRSGRSLLDALAWGTGWSPLDLLESFIDQLTDTLFSEDSQSLAARLITMEQYPSDNYSPLLSEIFQRKFHFYITSAVRSLLAKLGSKHFNAASKDDIRQLLWEKLWKDEKEELLSVIATAGHIRQPLVVIYPAKANLYSGLYTIKGFAMDPDMYFTTDFSHEELDSLVETFSQPPLLLFRVNNRWLAAIGANLEAYSELSELCKEFYTVKDLRQGIYVSPGKSAQQLPNARLMFSHTGIMSSVVLVAPEDVTAEMYQLFLVLNAMQINSETRFDLDALLGADSLALPRTMAEFSVSSMALAKTTGNPLTLIDIEPGHVREVLSQADDSWFKNRQKTGAVSYPSDAPGGTVTRPAALSAADKLTEAIESLNTPLPDLDRVISALTVAESIYSEVARTMDFAEDPTIREFDLIFQQASAHPMVRLRQLTLSSWADIVAGYVYVEQAGIRQQSIPADIYSQNEELELLQEQLLKLNLNELINNERQLTHFLELFSRALPDIEAVKFLPLAAKVRQLFSGKEEHLRLLQLHLGQLKTETAPKALKGSPELITGETAVATQATPLSVVDSSRTKTLLMQEFLAHRGYAQSGLLTDGQLLELSEDLGMTPLLHFLTEDQFQPDRQQLALPAPTVTPVGEPALKIAGQLIRTGKTRALVPVELPATGRTELVYHQANSQTHLQATPSQAMALLMSDRISPAEFIQASRPLRKALVREKLEAAGQQSECTLMGNIRDRLVSREILELPSVAGMKGLEKLPRAALEYKKTPGEAIKALPYTVPPDLDQYEKASTATSYSHSSP